ncbi:MULTISPECIES: YceD family protein [Alkalihalophilus]|uniref:DUF177 domain-containing protein n=1 Tax=Alkalihalophilus pseudofirmus (strain ATCC BAA-2126 / JCM 17055 / OF4) TaxID=398511 RepID=D3FU21_ALKPO|nr:MULTISPECIES: DUF177 domain-containing protein [Alkalihalophilus]ADC48223.1 hypothetical protein BpOF4_00770 [Alkalihalophilus pseudofirmus OF4]MEC2072991.1 DUF177 domain-containing protein [Alkalihalophilus marmarensis]OLS37369.1 hypothetical protein BTR22_07790 [Alkalihalophilus pseudofirmus]WEG15730.1 DUF177 domain-containing protein [Alkalihalophilus pseudofirmus]
MKWTLQQLQIAKHKPFIFDETIDLSDLKEQNAEIRNISPIRVQGELTYSGQLLTFSLHITGELTLPCSRTLVDVLFPIDLKVIEQFRPENAYHISKEDHEEANVITGDLVDLTPAIKEYILLEIPLQVYAENQEDPQAPPSGKGWGIVTEEDQEKKVDPRLADLAKFFDDKK